MLCEMICANIFYICTVCHFLWHQQLIEHGHRDKVERGCTTKTFHYPIQRYKSHFYTPTPLWRYRANKLWRSKAWWTLKVWRVDKKTQHFSPPQRRVKSENHQPWHGDRGSGARSCTLKTFGVWRIVSPLVGTENVGVTRSRPIKTSITP